MIQFVSKLLQHVHFAKIPQGIKKDLTKGKVLQPILQKKNLK